MSFSAVSLVRRLRAGLLTVLPGCWMALVLWTLPAMAQGTRPKGTEPDVPPVSMTCPMHPDVVETAPGTCPICKMNLVPMRLESAWTCPVHAVVSESQPGVCPICRRALIQVIVSVTWTCANRSDISQIDRGTCPDGMPMVAQRTLRPHGNHNPQHGGQFFMAPDNFHHLEGAYPRPRLFRVYFYDDYARPLPVAQVRQIRGRVVTKETFDSSTHKTTEVSSFPLAPGRSGLNLEARIGDTPLPAQMTAKLRFKDDAPEYRFDFTFPALTMEPAPQAGTAVSRGQPDERAGAAASPRRTVSPVSSAAAPPVAAGTSTPGPSTPIVEELEAAPTEDILARLESHQRRIGELVRQGDFAAVWVPAFQAKDVAVVLESRTAGLPADRREAAAVAIGRLVRTAWLLDAFGDIGNRQQIEEAYAVFSMTLAEIAALFQP